MTSDPTSDPDLTVTASLRLLQALGPAMSSGHRDAIVEIVRELLGLKAPLGDQWERLAHLVMGYGELTLARQAMDQFVAASGVTPAAIYRKAAVLEQAGAVQEAYDLLLTLPPDQPSPAAHAYSRGMAALFLGRFAEAREQLERATTLQPGSGAAWLSLVMAQEDGAGSDLANRLQSAAPAIGRSQPQQKAAYLYAMGKANEDLGRTEPAIAAFRQGAELMRSLSPFDRSLDLQDANEAIEGFTPDLVEHCSAPRTGWAGRTIFVTGLPRSGTTLVEQILASHSSVSGGAEIDRLPLLANEARGRSPATVEALSAGKRTEYLNSLWDHWMDERFGPGQRVVDKSLTTSRFLGLAASVLPESPVIWLTRDPLDCAWSCYKTFFEGRFPWTYDLTDIAMHFRIEDHLRERWRAVLGERILIVPYEDLVMHPQDWIGRILRHCGLAEEAASYTPHRTSRTVGTASVMQVRRPISRAAVGSSAPYKDFLKPFSDAYGNFSGD